MFTGILSAKGLRVRTCVFSYIIRFFEYKSFVTATILLSMKFDWTFGGKIGLNLDHMCLFTRKLQMSLTFFFLGGFSLLFFLGQLGQSSI